MPAKYEKLNLKEIVKDNVTGKLVLPNFQREFVWDRDKQKRLLSSFICNLPIGSLLILNGKKNDFACRNLCVLDDSVTVLDDCNYLLDGQQRLSSLTSFFNDLFKGNYDEIHDNLYSSLRNRWFLRLEPKERETDVFGWHKLRFEENDIFKYEPNDLYDFVENYQIFKKDKNKWWHPLYAPEDNEGKLLSKGMRREDIAENASREGLLPLWEFFSDSDQGIHELVLRKIAERRRHAIEASIGDNSTEDTYLKILGHLDGEIEEKSNSGVGIEEFWMELRTNWKKEVITCIKNCVVSQEIPIISLPADEVSRAVATFSAVNEGGTRLDPYDLIVARAAKDRAQKSLTKRVVESINKDVKGLNGVFGNSNLGTCPQSWSSFSFGALADNVPSAAFKDIFLNALSLFNHCKLTGTTPEVKHIKSNEILRLQHSQINGSTDDCIKSILRALSFLTYRCGIRTLSDLSYKLMLQPIINCFFDDEIFLNQKKVNKIEYWYWLSLFSGRYREHQNETCVEDFEQLFSFVQGGKNPYASSESKVLNYEGYSNLNALLMKDGEIVKKPIHNGVLNYVLSRQPRDFLINYRICPWWTGKELTETVGDTQFTIELHDHHIMPLATAKNINESTSELRGTEHILNSPLNRTYLLAKSNYNVGQKSVSDYVKKIQESSSYHHCIPSEDYTIKLPNETDEAYYERFLTARYNSLKSALIEELENLKS